MADPSLALFRFLDLPVELRLMVYERISIVTRHYILRYTTPISFVILVTWSVSTSLLATSRQVHSECFAALLAKMCGLASPPYLYYIVDSRQLVEFASRPSHYICATENTALQQGWSIGIESQVTVVAPVP